MFLVFSPIFVADTKIIFRYDFVAPLNSDLKKINDQAFQWKMTFNPDRRKQAQEITFSRKLKKATHPPLLLNNDNVSQANSQTHLGLILDVKLTFEEQDFYGSSLTCYQDKLQSLFTKHLLDLIQIMVMYSMTKLLIILSTQKWNPFNIMLVQQSQEPFEVLQEKKSARNQAQSLFNFVVGTENFVSFIKFSKISIQNTLLISFL